MTDVEAAELTEVEKHRPGIVQQGEDQQPAVSGTSPDQAFGARAEDVPRQSRHKRSNPDSRRPVACRTRLRCGALEPRRARGWCGHLFEAAPLASWGWCGRLFENRATCVIVLRNTMTALRSARHGTYRGGFMARHLRTWPATTPDSRYPAHRRRGPVRPPGHARVRRRRPAAAGSER
jgi:hypothetical protein